MSKHVIDLRTKPFAMVSRALLEDTSGDLTRPLDKLVYAMLCMYANNETKAAYPSIKRLAELCHCSERSVRYSIDRLKKAEYMAVEMRLNDEGRQLSNRYYLLDK